MKGKKSNLQQAQDEAQVAINLTNKLIEELGGYTSGLYRALTDIQELFDKIRNVPNDRKFKYEELKQIRLNWRQQAKKIEKDYQEAIIKNVGVGVAGASFGVAIVTMGPTVAMGVATTFGVASTGTAIYTLGGAAATNAALAWLGGGALAAGGGGMAAGETFLVLAGPIGWAIAGISLVTSGLFFWKSKRDKKHVESIFLSISHRDVKSYKLAVVELKERIARIIKESSQLSEAIECIQMFEMDYNLMSEEQQYMLGSYVNLMLSSTQLLINPIKGLLPKFSLQDFDDFIGWDDRKARNSICEEHKDFIIFLTNLLYKIELDDKDKKLLWKSLRKNKQLLKSINISKKEFNLDIMSATLEALEFKYRNVVG